MSSLANAEIPALPTSESTKDETLNKKEFEDALSSESIFVGENKTISFTMPLAVTAIMSCLALILGFGMAMLISLISSKTEVAQPLPESNPLALTKLFAVTTLFIVAQQTIIRLNESHKAPHSMQLEASIFLLFVPAFIAGSGLAIEIITQHPQELFCIFESKQNEWEFCVGHETGIAYPFAVLSPAILVYIGGLVAFMLTSHLILEFIEAPSSYHQGIRKAQKLNRFDTVLKTFLLLTRSKERSSMVRRAVASKPSTQGKRNKTPLSDGGRHSAGFWRPYVRWQTILLFILRIVIFILLVWIIANVWETHVFNFKDSDKTSFVFAVLILTITSLEGCLIAVETFLIAPNKHVDSASMTLTTSGAYLLASMFFVSNLFSKPSDRIAILLGVVVYFLFWFIVTFCHPKSRVASWKIFKEGRVPNAENPQFDGDLFEYLDQPDPKATPLPWCTNHRMLLGTRRVAEDLLRSMDDLVSDIKINPQN